jgi:hypothetical protein
MLAPVQLAVLFQLPAAFAFHESLVAEAGDTMARAGARNPNALEYTCFMEMGWLKFEGGRVWTVLV